MNKMLRLSLLALTLAATLCIHPAQAQTLFMNILSASYSATNAQTIKVITGNSKAPTLVMQYQLTASAAGTVQIEYGTGSTCGTGTVVMTGAMAMGGSNGSIQAGNGGGALMVIPTGNDVCVVSTGTATFGGHFSYLQY